ncbi:uncharacterized protein [Oscarella lobularis]|uniref:uncharacterized protein n=1 Tax=Oscarella lobularis TaxID=121494 RepID=UPI003313192E
MASNRDIEDKAVATALDDVQKAHPDEFAAVLKDPQRKKEFEDAARDAAREVLKLSSGLRPDMAADEIEAYLEKALSKERVQQIKNGLNIPTYQIRLNKKDDGKTWADITRDGEEFMPSRALVSLAAVKDVSWIQIASVIIEAVMLVLSAVGIKLAVDEKVIQKTAQEIVPVVESSSALQKAVDALKEAFKNGSNYDKAKAIFYLIKDSYSAGILWKIIKSLCSNMSTWDWIKTAGIVSAMIIAALATDGVALIAKIVLALNSAYEFVKKVLNLSQLDEMSV